MTRGLQRWGILGAGAWGTALAVAAARAGREALLWTHRPEVAAGIVARHENPDYLPGQRLDPRIEASADPAALADRDALLLAVPAQHLREATQRLASLWPQDRPVVVCAKGIEQRSGLTMTGLLRQTLPGRPLAVLSGPTFAAEVAADLPTAATVAAADEGLGQAIVEALANPRFRLYWSSDVTGVELGGAIKNVLAIACGIVIGRRLGDNARAALIARGLAEMMRFAVPRGARPETLMGLSGLGDLVLTCSGRQSRNLSLGVALGEGRSLAEHQAGRRSVAEGVWTASVLRAQAEAAGIEMPIVRAVDEILNRGAAIDQAIDALLSRPLRAEG
ncbi:NAD(P)H-dependent glycerol-3-phosphate dehydrogenase [Hypericibacter adhaerens]|uniref:NAD(P)H-dependent glycerol-3-phosphate dehydrogenase n=1 Tax=Hypericibacter adhaerens TaxID=2602016 RepID=UPI0012463C5E|nr:NAD(P)H-dependent glycerol-3-phosphate dehydrogenase [Hypericibacter adhaerens]